MSSARIVSTSLAEAPHLELLEFRAELHRAMGRDARLVTLFGRRDGARVILTAVLEREGRSSVLRSHVGAGDRYHALTEELPALHIFERELHEQLGIDVRGHPWLKPVRFEGASPSSRDAYPFYPITGKEVHEVAVGPVHAGVIEPGAFRFMCHGEDVHHLEIHLGYQHRGVETLLLRSNPRKLAPLVETIAGDSSIAHAWAYAAAIETLGGYVVSPALDECRAVLLELERVGLHLATLAGLAADIGFLQGASTYGRLRTTAINTMMRACGSRFGRSAIRPGGSGVQWSFDDLRKSVALLRHDGALIDEHFGSAWTVNHRLRGAGILSRELAERIGSVGVVARASGISVDVRAGGEIPVVTAEEGDCSARARVRIGEIRASLDWMAGWLEKEREAWKPTRNEIGSLARSHLVVARVESPRGEVVHALETDADGGLAHYKVQDPSFRNWLGLALAMRGNAISDFPICNKSFDLSYCGSDL